MAWWLSLILFCWVCVQKLLLLSLQEACTLFLYFLWAVHADASSVSKHERQSPEAVSMSEWSTLPLDNSELEEGRSSVLLGFPASATSSRPLAVALEGLGWLACSYPSCSRLVPGPVSGANLGVSQSHWVVLDPALASTYGEQTWVLLVWWSGELLGEWFCFPWEECSGIGLRHGGDALMLSSSNGPCSGYLCSRKASLQRCTRTVHWQPSSNLLWKIPHGRWHLSAQPSVPPTLCASWPVWLTYVHTFQPTLHLLDELIFQLGSGLIDIQ